MTMQALLEDIRKTNPTMTKKKLIEELKKSETSSMVLIAMRRNDKKSA